MTVELDRTSDGVVYGRARRVGSVADLARLGPQDVVVAASMPPGWATLLPEVAAVVLATGGALSNTAIVLRERGIPAVMGVGAAVGRLRPGQLLEVDAAHERVRPIGED
jgi:pyruvate,water dikinase